MSDHTKPIQNLEDTILRNLAIPVPAAAMQTKADPTVDSTEVVLHELGESIAVSVASVQREFAWYPNAFSCGAFGVHETWTDNGFVGCVGSLCPAVPTHATFSRGEESLQNGIKSPADFVNQDSAKLAEVLSARFKLPIPPESVQVWQNQAREFMKIPLPSPPLQVDKPP